MLLRGQVEHNRINAICYPGTRQLCIMCDSPTDRCEEDSIFTKDGNGPLCTNCYDFINLSADTVSADIT